MTGDGSSLNHEQQQRCDYLHVHVHVYVIMFIIIMPKTLVSCIQFDLFLTYVFHITGLSHGT